MSSDDSNVAERRRRLVAKALAARREQPVESSHSSSSSSSSDEEDEAVRLKPVFISKSQREPVKEDPDPEVEIDEDFLERQREKIKQDALLSEQIDQGIKASETWSDMQPKAPPIGDEDTEENYQKWKLRELKRIMRYRLGQDPDANQPLEEEESSSRKKLGVFFRS